MCIPLDGSWSVIGSADMDTRSRQINEEDIFGVSSIDFAAKLENTFVEDRGKSKEITLSEWEKRGLWQRVREIFARKFVQQF